MGWGWGRERASTLNSVDPGVLVDKALHAVEVDDHRRKFSSRTMQVDLGPDVWCESSSCLEQLTYLGSREYSKTQRHYGRQIIIDLTLLFEITQNAARWD